MGRGPPCVLRSGAVQLFGINWHAGPTLGTTPTRRPPTWEDWVATTLDGQWYWDGAAWQRTVANPWPQPAPAPPYPYPCTPMPTCQRTQSIPTPPARTRGRGWPEWLLFPLLLVTETLARGFARAVGVVVRILSLGVTVALLVWLFTR